MKKRYITLIIIGGIIMLTFVHIWDQQFRGPVLPPVPEAVTKQELPEMLFWRAPAGSGISWNESETRFTQSGSIMLKIRPQKTITILLQNGNGNITISLDDGSVTIPPGVDVNEGAATFWKAITMAFNREDWK